MDQQVIDIARQHLNLPDSITDDEIVRDLEGSSLVTEIEAGIAMRELKTAVFDILEPIVKGMSKLLNQIRPFDTT